MKKLTIFSFLVAVVSFAIAGLTAKAVGEEGFKKFADTAIEKKFSGFQSKTRELMPPKNDTLSNYHTLEIIGISESVKLLPADDGKISVEYPEVDNAPLEAEWKNGVVTTDLGHYLKGRDDRLVVSFMKNGPNITINSLESFEVVYRIPKTISHVLFRSKSGNLRALDVQLENMDAETVSGNLKFSGKADLAHAKTVSGNIKWTSEKGDPKVNFESVSGDIKVNFKSSPDFKVAFNTVSGSLKMDIDEKRTHIEGNNSLKVGSGNGELNLKTVSGDVKIRYEKTSEVE